MKIPANTAVFQIRSSGGSGNLPPASTRNWWSATSSFLHLHGVSGTTSITWKMWSEVCAGSRHGLKLPCATPTSKLRFWIIPPNSPWLDFLLACEVLLGLLRRWKGGGNWNYAAFHPPFDPVGNMQDEQERGLWASCASQKVKMGGQWLCFGSYRAGTGIHFNVSPTNKVVRAKGAVATPVQRHQPAGRSSGEGMDHPGLTWSRSRSRNAVSSGWYALHKPPCVWSSVEHRSYN